MVSVSILHDLASRRFLVLEPSWTVGKALDLLDALEPEYVLLAEGSDETSPVSAATAVELELRLNREAESRRLDELPHLTRNLHRPPHCDAYLPVHEAPDLCLVVDEGAVIGVWDAYENPGPWRSGEDAAQRLEVEHEPVVDLGRETSLLVFLETDELVGEDSIPLEIPAGSEIEVWVRARRGFVVEGARSRRLRVEEPGRAFPLVFKLRAVEEGVGRVEIHALFGAEPLGRLVVAPRVYGSKGTGGNPRSGSFPTISTSGARLRRARGDRPDLTLTILETSDREGAELEFRFHTKGSEVERFGPFPIAADPHPRLNQLFMDLEDARGFTSDSAIRRQLQQTGAFLFERLLPEALQRRLWETRDRIDTVQILSDEVIVPWELCVLCGPEHGRTAEAEHFCEAFALTRWWSGGDCAREISLCNMGVIAPSESGLPGAEEEARFLLDRATADCPVDRLPGSYVDLIEAFDRGCHGAFHFTGHGVAVTDSGDWASIDLDQGECLRPMDLSGIASNLGRARPLVFLNACRTGYGGRSLQGIGGWASQFLRVGAGAFVGTLWSVRTRSARRFAEVFYEALIDGIPMGSAARRARCAVRDEFPNETTWLAYTVFADPLAKVVSK